MRLQGLRFCVPFLGIFLVPGIIHAQPAPSLANEGPLATYHGSVHALARPENDQGAVADEVPLPRLLLMMARPADREKALQQFLRDVHAPDSASYHQWLTPEQFGSRFGAQDEDIQAVTGWLQSHGLSVARVGKNRSIVEFSGTAGQIREALHTEIHQYSVQGKTFYANASEIAVPATVASRIRNFAPLNSLPLTSYVKTVGSGTINRASHRVAPQFTISQNSAPFYAFGPKDFTTQYDVAPVYAAGMNGAGQTIGIIGTNNLNLAVVDAYRKLFNLPADHTQVIIDGQDPGDGSQPDVEGYLDVEMSGAVAPGATVNYYIAGAEAISTATSDSLVFAALRAVEDNQASVLSVSYGSCEQILGEAGNQLWASLWEQAAVQGQTVFVSSGDSGPMTCDEFIVSSGGTQQFPNGVSVNGVGSTPWNISVGGTDFYYSDYASGAPSAATLWNQNNDSSNGSLKAPLPEQVWDNAFGFDVDSFFPPAGTSVFSFNLPTAAGGGGVSNCSQTTAPVAGAFPSCLAGYAKPGWQNAPGVPNDQARDLPDVSLFASNGVNVSAIPLCAESGDCAAVSSGDPQVTLVGGTSASSPAMAGIFALIDQKYGRQGQANYTLYALARQFPSVFHDITLGTNDVVCSRLLPDCDVPVPNQLFYFYSFGEYPAGPGYDLASGLGSVDVNQLLTNWNKVTYTPSTTTLQASPASIVHGAAVTVSVAVKAGSGSATPTGNVALLTSPGTTIPANIPLALTNGAASASLTNLPGGAYELTAQYGGDGTFASSTSSPVSLTVTPEPSSTALTYAFRAATLPGTLPQGQVPFGASMIFTATPSSQAAKTNGLATGTVTFTDGSTTATIPLDDHGVATWQPPSFSLGAHSVTAAFSGDASFQPSTSAPLALTVAKSTPRFIVASDVTPVGCDPNVTFCGSNGGEIYEPGSDQVLSVLLYGTSAAPPTGSVTVTFGSLTQTVNLTPVAGIGAAWVTFPNVPAGTYALSATYSGDANWSPATYTDSLPFVYADPQLSVATSTTALTLSPSTVDSSGSVTFHVTTQAASNQNGCFLGAGLALLYANGVSFGAVQVACNIVNGVPTISGSATLPGSELPPGTYQVVAGFQGFATELSSFSNSVPLTVNVTDFSLSALGKSFTVAAGKSVTIPIALGGPSNSAITVMLSCQTSSPSIACTVGSPSSSVTGTATASITVNAFTSSTAAAKTGAGPKPGRFPIRPAEGLVLAVLAFAFLPGRKHAAKLWVLLLLLAGFSFATGCGSSSPPSGPSGPTITNAAAGSYSITVTGISGGITHSATINIQVQ